MPFVTHVKVRFGDVDRAGIVYYPVVLHYCHVVFEEFFEGHVGIPYPKLLEERRLGFPTVRLETSFEAPFRYGRTVLARLRIETVCDSSTVWSYSFHEAAGHDTAGDVLLARSRNTTVAVDMDTFRPVAVPDDLRASFARARD